MYRLLYNFPSAITSEPGAYSATAICRSRARVKSSLPFPFRFPASCNSTVSTGKPYFGRMLFLAKGKYFKYQSEFRILDDRIYLTKNSPQKYESLATIDDDHNVIEIVNGLRDISRYGFLTPYLQLAPRRWGTARTELGSSHSSWKGSLLLSTPAHSSLSCVETNCGVVRVAGYSVVWDLSFSPPLFPLKSTKRSAAAISRPQRSFITFHGALWNILLSAGFPAMFHMITSEQTFVNNLSQKIFLRVCSAVVASLAGAQFFRSTLLVVLKPLLQHTVLNASFPRQISYRNAILKVSFYDLQFILR